MTIITLADLARIAELADPPPDPYLNDPAGWITSHGGFLWSKQIEIVESVRDNRRTAVKACHGPGKSWTAAEAVSWWVDAHPVGTALAVTSAPTWPQVKNILWRELRKNHTKAGLDGRITLDCNWYIGEELVAFGRKPADHDEDGFQGIHAEFVLVVLDEGCGIPAQLVRAALALLTNEDARILIIGNPTDPTSEFATLCDGAPDDGSTGVSSKGYNTITISAFDTPNFTGEPVPDAVRRALVSKMWVDEFLIDVGTVDSPLYVSKVLGQFPTDASDGVIPWSWLTKCTVVDEAQASELVPCELGVDIAGSELGDETVIYERLGCHVGRRWSVRSADPEVVLATVEHAVREATPLAVKIDSIGIGWGLQAPLRRTFPGLNVVPVNVSESAANPKRFVNKRAEMWWEVGRALSKDHGWDLSPLTVPAAGHDSTLAELAAPRWSEDSSGRVRIESKDDIRKRIGRSTDNADALLMAFYTPAGNAPPVQRSYRRARTR